MSTPTFCQQCGAPLTATAKFCNKCGTPVEAAAQPPQAPAAPPQYQPVQTPQAPPPQQPHPVATPPPPPLPEFDESQYDPGDYGVAGGGEDSLVKKPLFWVAIVSAVVFIACLAVVGYVAFQASDLFGFGDEIEAIGSVIPDIEEIVTQMPEIEGIITEVPELEGIITDMPGLDALITGLPGGLP